MDRIHTATSPLQDSEPHQRLRKLSVAFAAMQAASIACLLRRDFDGFRTSLDIEREILAEQEDILQSLGA
jgi:hypothetical protein